MTENLKIEHVTTAEKAAEYMEKGYCIVDCSPEGVRCFLTNGPEGDCGFTLNSPRVAQLAYGPYFAARQKNPCFVTTGPPRVDAIFGILALAGELPHPKRADQFKDAVHELSERFTRDLTRLAQFADQMELDPLRISSEHKEGKLLNTWKGLMRVLGSNTLAFNTGAGLLLGLTGEPLEYLDSATESTLIEYVSPTVAVIGSGVWDIAFWYPDVAPVIVTFDPKDRRAVVDCRSLTMAEAVFGPGGLKKVLAELGWQGREETGASPLGVHLSLEKCFEAARKIAGRVKG